jgi:hypothetical protein
MTITRPTFALPAEFPAVARVRLPRRPGKPCHWPRPPAANLPQPAVMVVRNFNRESTMLRFSKLLPIPRMVTQPKIRRIRV